MSWLDGRLPKWRRSSGGNTALLEREEPPEPEVLPDDNTPKLMVLVSDASGVACFKSHSFPDARSATEFVLYWFREDADGFSAFWAMKEEPPEDIPAGAVIEPLVLINDAIRSDVVYSFSFVDIESAQGFVRDEIENGTDGSQINLYWALPVRLTTNANGKTMLAPSVPPGAAPEEDSDEAPTDMWAARNESAAEQVATVDHAAEQRRVLQEAPDAYTGVANGLSVGQETFELTSWIERRSRDRRSGDRRSTEVVEVEATVNGSREARDDSREYAPSVTHEVISELPEAETVGATAEAAEEPLAMVVEVETRELEVSDESEERVAEAVGEAIVEDVEPEALEVLESDAPVIERVAEDVEEAEIEAEVVGCDHPPHPLEVVDGAERDGETNEPPEHSVDEIDAAVQTITPPLDVEGDSRLNEGHEESLRHGNGFIALDPADLVVHTNGHSKIETSEAPPEGAEAPEATIETEADTDDGETEAPIDIGIDLDLGSSRALKMKRWEAKENPFDGFKSPPGRF